MEIINLFKYLGMKLYVYNNTFLLHFCLLILIKKKILCDCYINCLKYPVQRAVVANLRAVVVLVFALVLYASGRVFTHRTPIC